MAEEVVIKFIFKFLRRCCVHNLAKTRKMSVRAFEVVPVIEKLVEGKSKTKVRVGICSLL